MKGLKEHVKAMESLYGEATCARCPFAHIQLFNNSPHGFMCDLEWGSGATYNYPHKPSKKCKLWYPDEHE